MSAAMMTGVLLVAGLGLIAAVGWLITRPSAEEKEALAARRSEAGRQLLGELQRLARPALLVTSTGQPGFSKLGGEPELPRGLEWPRAEGRSLAFLAQLDLAEARAAGGPEWLPERGRLWAFNDDDAYGTRDHVLILHAPAGVEIERRIFPADLHKRHQYGERRVGFRRMISVPSPAWLAVDPSEVDFGDAGAAELADILDGPSAGDPQHRIGGYPAEIQDERMAISCELMARDLRSDAEVSPAIEQDAEDWRLLLQIDSDPALGMNFGDAGRLYVFIREEHARTGDFSKTVANWHTH